MGWGGVGVGWEGWGSHTSEHPGSTSGLCTYRKNPKCGQCLGIPHTEAACTYDPRVYKRSPSPRVQTTRFPRVQTNPCPAGCKLASLAALAHLACGPAASIHCSTCLPIPWPSPFFFEAVTLSSVVRNARTKANRIVKSTVQEPGETYKCVRKQNYKC